MKFSLEELALIRWALLVAVEWEQESIRCQSDQFDRDKSLAGYEEFNAESERRIIRSNALSKRISASIKRRTS